LIAEVVSVLRARAQEKGIVLEYHWTSEIPETIWSDPYRLRQLLMNLVGNAVKFTAHGSVQIRSRLEKDQGPPQLVIDVCDTGIGISEEHLETIFSPFVQADNSVTRKFGGTGLGLAISRNICQSLGGSLTVASNPGKGSTFTAVLPAGDLVGVRLSDHPSTEHRGDIIDTREDSVNLAGVKVLLADDGDTNRKLIRLFLSRQGAEVHAVENGELAVATTMSQSFDVILMDMQMPVMDGYVATRKLRESGYAKPIIALTAHAMAGDRKKCEEAGCTGYLSKPVNVDELVRIVLSAANAGRRTSARVHAAPARTDERGDTMQGSIRSTLPVDDPEICELVAEFAASLPERIEALTRALEAADFDEILRLAHALKGAGGTAGFMALSEVSARLEDAARRRVSVGVSGALRELRSVSERIEAGGAPLGQVSC
jgi:CheY-like chemotaxis protein/HPt (histidine-containing phosphotransfer) domain-containing protein